MIKKYKNKIIATVISVVFLIVMYVLIGNVYSLYNPSKEQYMNSKATSLLGKTISMNGSFWSSLYNQGNLTCFWHKESGYSYAGMNNRIHSVFDIGFDETEGRIKIESIVNTTPRKTKTSYASSSKTSVGKLAAEASRNGNSFYVQNALYEAIREGTVARESAIANEMQWAASGTKNHASRSKINEYNNYKKITDVTKGTPEEKEKQATINNKLYTIMGPFKISFEGKAISSITVNNAKWSSSSDTDIYWSASESTDKKDWSNKFNEAKSGKYTLDKKQFFIAVETSKLPEDGTYTVSIKQEKFEYYNARIAVCVGSRQQQTGLYVYDNTPHTVNGEVSWNLKRKGLKTLIISKVDEKSGKELNGAGFKIYAELKDGTKGWVSGDAKSTKTYGKNATEYSAKTEIKNLKYGTYYIYETKAPDNCALSEQTGYKQASNGSTDLTGDWVFVGSQALEPGSGSKITVKITNKSLATTEIIKKDKTTGMVLSGGKFKLYAVLNDGTKGWISGDATGDKTYGNTATEYPSSTKIEKLKYGTYYLYETETPSGYDITKQDGYKQAAEGSSSLTGDWVYLGNKVIDVNFPDDGAFKFEVDNKKVVGEIEGDVWIENPDRKDNGINHIYDGQPSNDELKEGIKVNLYDANNKLLAETTTDKNGHYKFTNKNKISDDDKDIYYWDLNGAYVEFIYNNKTTYNEDGTVKERGYVVVNPFTGTDAKVNSKAQELTMTKEKLDDNKLTGIEGANPGKAVTSQTVVELDNSKLVEENNKMYQKIKENTATADDLKNAPLAYYYDEATYKISNINLGLLEQYDADYSVDENLAYIKVNMKGYTYTYKYGDAPASESKYVPTVNEQNSTKSYTGKIYPTDIAYNVANNTDELKVYVVYSIDVKNNETMYIDDLYTEERLYLDSLVNSYDTNRYELCTNENTSDKSDFALWSDKDGVASYDVNNENSVYKNGIGKQETETSYIQFKIKDEALKKILERKVTESELENAPTIATASGYHEYLRTDNVWEHKKDVRAFDGAKGANVYPITSESNNKRYYVHKTINKSQKSSALYLKLSLGEPRKISGTVFEDTKTEQSEKDGTNLGNGKIDDNEKNRAQTVKVELLNADKSTVTKLYKENDGKVVYNEDGSLPDANVTTEVGGTYEFEGVTPGYYYIRFTYGDGRQKMIQADNTSKDIKSNDYKSTIINTETDGAGDIIKNAMESKSEDLNAITEIIASSQTEAQKKIVEWYKYLNNSNYSTAVDDLNERAKFDKYKYSEEGIVYDESGNVVTDYPSNINAYTPITSISIENDVNVSKAVEGVKGKDGTIELKDDTYKSNYEGFNFGLIKQPKTEIELNKMITNVKLTAQTGTTIVSANPTDRTSTYLTALDKITGGSKYAKMEMDESLIYGSALETTYEIKIENKSDKEYIEDENSSDYGKYYLYGEKTNTSKLKAVKVNEIVDELDKKYNYDSTKTSSEASVVHQDGSTENIEVSITKNNPDGNTELSNSLKMTGWKEFESGATESMSYVVTSLLSRDNNTEYTNEAKVTSISLDKLTTLPSSFNWNLAKDTTTLSIEEAKGSDKRGIYWIAGIIGLIVLAAGIIFIKKKALKK